jgi:hypothetical protein
VLAEEGADIEIGPPQRRREDQSQHRSGDDDPGDRLLGHPNTNGDDRLAKGNDHNQSVSFREMSWRWQPPSHEGCHLSKREHENQIKEQLKRGDPRLILFLTDKWMSSLHGNIVQATAGTQVAGGS